MPGEDDDEGEEEEKRAGSQGLYWRRAPELSIQQKAKATEAVAKLVVYGDPMYATKLAPLLVAHISFIRDEVADAIIGLLL